MNPMIYNVYYFVRDIDFTFFPYPTPISKVDVHLLVVRKCFDLTFSSAADVFGLGYPQLHLCVIGSYPKAWM